MTPNAFVKALRGPEDAPDNINPLSYLLTAVHTPWRTWTGRLQSATRIWTRSWT
jgi:hypothetical protein